VYTVRPLPPQPPLVALSRFSLVYKPGKLVAMQMSVSVCLSKPNHPVYRVYRIHSLLVQCHACTRVLRSVPRETSAVIATIQSTTASSSIIAFSSPRLSVFRWPPTDSVLAGADCLRRFRLCSTFRSPARGTAVGMLGFDMNAIPNLWRGSEESNLAGRKTSGRRAGLGRWNA